MERVEGVRGRREKPWGLMGCLASPALRLLLHFIVRRIRLGYEKSIGRPGAQREGREASQNVSPTSCVRAFTPRVDPRTDLSRMPLVCGIAGIIGRIDDGNQSALRRMGAAMAHRGPDGEQAWISPADSDGMGCLFLHRRLAILDLTDFAAQPMVDPVKHHVIVFNGEIYNYNLLRDELVAAGEKFESTGDTAVMLRALALWARAPSSASAECSPSACGTPTPANSRSAAIPSASNPSTSAKIPIRMEIGGSHSPPKFAPSSPRV